MYKGILPYSMQDESNMALEKCIDKAFDIDLSPFMTALPDFVSPNVLYFLAEQLSLTDGDGYSECKTEQEKRDLIKKAIKIHRMKATTKCMNDLCANSTVKLLPWFEYDGLNNHYKLIVEGGSLEDVEKTISMINRNKRLSSKPDILIYELKTETENILSITPVFGEVITINF